jgi:tRNA threonylcarbamoyladenosine biosynthesis protein TsaE
LHSPDLKPARTFFLPTESDTLALGAALGRTLAPGLVIFVRGELGAGKTTLARGVLRGLEFTGRVKSPTFTLVEVYKLSKLNFYHFDFYRFDRPQELEETGFRDYFAPDAVCLVEWPEKAAGLPAADINIVIEATGLGRTVGIHAGTEVGGLCLDRLKY